MHGGTGRPRPPPPPPPPRNSAVSEASVVETRHHADAIAVAPKPQRHHSRVASDKGPSSLSANMAAKAAANNNKAVEFTPGSSPVQLNLKTSKVSSVGAALARVKTPEDMYKIVKRDAISEIITAENQMDLHFDFLLEHFADPVLNRSSEAYRSAIQSWLDPLFTLKAFHSVCSQIASQIEPDSDVSNSF
jgi:hypothetical protein